LYVQARRVLRPNGRLALHEIVAGPVQPVLYPAPWSADGSMSFLLPQTELRALIARSSFRELAWEDVTETSLAWFKRVAPPAFRNGNLPPLGMHLLLGQQAAPAVRGQVQNIEERRVEVVQAVFERL
jgi:hypothetical protein